MTMLEAGYHNAILLIRDGDAATRGQWELGPFPQAMVSGQWPGGRLQLSGHSNRRTACD